MSDVLGGMPTYRSQEKIQLPGVAPVSPGAAGGISGALSDVASAFREVTEPVGQAQAVRSAASAELKTGPDGKPKPDLRSDFTPEGRAYNQIVTGRAREETERGDQMRAARAGQGAVDPRALGPDGLPVAPSLQSDFTPTGRAYNVAALSAYSDSVLMAKGGELARLRIENSEHPELYRAKAEGVLAGVAQSVPPELRGPIMAKLTETANGHEVGLLDQVTRRDAANNRATWGMAFGQSRDVLEAYALQGKGPGDPDYDKALVDVDSRINTGVATGYINGEMGAIQREQARLGAEGARFAGRYEQIANLFSPEEATRQMRQDFDSPAMMRLDAKTRNEMETRATARIGAVTRARAVAAASVRDDFQNYTASVRAGARPDPSTLLPLEQRATAAGLGPMAADIRAWGAIAGEISEASKLSVPEIQTRVEKAQAFASSNPMDPSSGIRITEMQRLLTERATALVRDPAGEARRLAGVALPDGAPASQQQISAMVRAQDAILRQNLPIGTPDSALPILTAAEKKSLQDIEAAGPVAAAKLIQGIFAKYGPEYALRVQADLHDPDSHVPEKFRAISWLLTSPQATAAIPTYIAALELEGKGQLDDYAGGASNAKAVRDAVEKNTAVLRETASRGGTDAAMVADLQSVERRMALLYSHNMDPKSAAYLAHQQVVESQLLMVNDGNVQLRIPRERLTAGFDEGLTIRTLRAMSGPMLSAVELEIPPNAVGEGGGIEAADRQEMYKRSLAAKGTWRISPDHTAAWLEDGNGQKVWKKGADGRLEEYQVNLAEIRPGNLFNFRSLQGSHVSMTRDAGTAAGLSGPAADTWMRMIWRENGMRPTGTSRAGAEGIAQIMPATAAKPGFGMEPLAAADLNDPAKALPWAARYYSNLLNHYQGNHAAAAAAYNAGMGRVDEYLAGGRLLPGETQAYVQAVTGQPFISALPRPRISLDGARGDVARAAPPSAQAAPEPPYDPTVMPRMGMRR